jgi:DNA/RNA-binding domain of Phe-tRNA-synthetase-like protein
MLDSAMFRHAKRRPTAGSGRTTQLVVADEVCAKFGDLRIDAVVAAGFEGAKPWPEVEERMAALEARARAGGIAAEEDDPHIASWHAAYRAFGTNPRRQRPSVHALLRRLARSGRLPRIGPAVDCYNLVSASHGVPVGAFDLQTVTGQITIRFADGSEVFTPLGEPGAAESPHPGEAIYTDAGGVLTRHWNHRDADRTKVTEHSTEIVFVLETVEASSFGVKLDEATGTLVSLLSARSTGVAVHHLTAAHRTASL